MGNPSGDAFVAKLNPAGTKLFYSTFLGGEEDDILYAIAVDDSGDAYITGYTTSSNYPTTIGAYDTGYNSGNNYGDVFVTKLELVDPPPSPIFINSTSPQLVDNSFWLFIKVGDQISPVSNLFGVSFILNYTNTLHVDVVEPMYGNVSPGDKMGAQAVIYRTTNEAAGQLHVGVSRKRGQPGVSGYGFTVVKVRMIARSPIPNGTIVNFSITDVQANDPEGEPIFLSPRSRKMKIIYDNSPVAVWPGDTDNSGKVDEADVLPLGWFWGVTGLQPARMRRCNGRRSFAPPGRRARSRMPMPAATGKWIKATCSRLASIGTKHTLLRPRWLPKTTVKKLKVWQARAFNPKPMWRYCSRARNLSSESKLRKCTSFSAWLSSCFMISPGWYKFSRSSRILGSVRM
ncbi:MAG: SBBP repeat-containing protein [bacterium]